MRTIAALGKFTNNAILIVRSMFVITFKIIIISLVKKVLGEPGAVSSVKTKKEPWQKVVKVGRENPWDATLDEPVLGLIRM